MSEKQVVVGLTVLYFLFVVVLEMLDVFRKISKLPGMFVSCITRTSNSEGLYHKCHSD